MNGALAFPRLGPAALRPAAIALFAAVLLTTSGAFDTEAAAFGPRLGYWMAVAAVSTVALEAGQVQLRRRLPGRTEFMLRTVNWAGLFLPLNGVAAIGCKLLFGGSPSIGGFVHLLPGMAVILAALQLVLMSYACASARSPIVRSFPVPAPPASALEAALPLPLRGAQIEALQAEDHYVRVHTAAGSALVRMRFGDALDGVKGQDGVQPHRSWWVARASVRAMQRKGDRAELVLRGGQQVPVSRRARSQLGPLFDGISS